MWVTKTIYFRESKDSLKVSKNSRIPGVLICLLTWTLMFYCNVLPTWANPMLINILFPGVQMYARTYAFTFVQCQWLIIHVRMFTIFKDIKYFVTSWKSLTILWSFVDIKLGYHLKNTWKLIGTEKCLLCCWQRNKSKFDISCMHILLNCFNYNSTIVAQVLEKGISCQILLYLTNVDKEHFWQFHFLKMQLPMQLQCSNHVFHIHEKVH